MALDQSDLILATVRFQEAITIAENASSNIPIPWAQLNLGKIKYAESDITGAVVIFKQMLALFREYDHWGGVAQTLLDLARAARAQGDNARAIAIYRESLPWCYKDGSIRDIAYCLAGLGWVAGLQKQPTQAARLFGAAEAIRASIGMQPPPVLRAEYKRDVTATRAQLDDASFAAAWAAGRALTVEEAITEALAGTALDAKESAL